MEAMYSKGAFLYLQRMKGRKRFCFSTIKGVIFFHFFYFLFPFSFLFLFSVSHFFPSAFFWLGGLLLFVLDELQFVVR